MTTLTQSIIDKRKDINAGPDNVIFARLDALNAIQLTKDIFTGNADDFVNRNYASSTTQNLYELAKAQAEILAFCRGANTNHIQTFGNLSNTTVYDTSTVTFTFPTSTTFGVQILTLDGETEIAFSNTPGSTQTITNDDGTSTTLSTYFKNYYFAQNRKTGSLAKSTDPNDLNAILRPTAINPIGANTAFTESGEIGTWNEFYAVMNIENLETTNNVKFVTLERSLANGSEGSFEVPKLYDALVLKRNIEDGGEDADSQAFVAVVVCEGLQINPNWLPVGSNTGDYSATNANTYKATLLDDADFKTKCGIFNCDNMDANTNPLFKSLSANLVSTSQEVPIFSDNYPNIEKNPLKPFVTNKAELQPTGLGDNDLFCGRYVHIEKDRKNASGGDDEDYRFVIDTASKYFLQVNPLLTLSSSGAYSIASGIASDTDFQHQYSENIAAVVDTLTGMTHDTTNYPYELAKQIYNGTTEYNSGTKSFGSHTYAYTTYPATTTTALAGRSSTESTSSTHTIKINADGTPNDSGAVSITLTYDATPPQTNHVNHYYYILKADGDKLNYEPHIVRYTISRSGSQLSYTYQMNTSVSTGDQFLAPILYNQVQVWKESNAGQRIIYMIDNLYSYRNLRDPNFEAYYDGVTSATPLTNKATAQANYENFYDRISDTNSKKSSWQTAHNNYKSSALTTTSTLDYETLIFNDELNDYKTSLNTFETSRLERITTLSARIGTPTYANTDIAPQDDSGTLYAYQVTTIPTIAGNVTDHNTQEANVTPYGRKLFDVVNSFLDSDTGYLRDVLEKINNIQFAFDKINQDRNIYEVLNNRSKQL